MDRPARFTVAWLLVALGALAVFLTARFLEDGSMAASSAEARSTPARSSNPMEADSPSPSETSSTSSATILSPPIRESDVDPRLVPPERAELRRIEQQGRALFFGLVLDPKGQPCPDATIFHAGEAVTTSDAHGAWRIEVEHDVLGVAQRLAAWRGDVGVRCVQVAGPSRRIDLQLAPGHRLNGRCLDRATHAPVAGAEVVVTLSVDVEEPPTAEFVGIDPVVVVETTAAGPGLTLAATSDEQGVFAFDHLPSGSFVARARALHHDSNGSESFDFRGERDRDYLLQLDSTIRVRGVFSPWPPPGGPFTPAPRVVARVLSPRNRQIVPQEYQGAIDAVGRFAVELPGCVGLDLALLAGNGALWCWNDRPDQEHQEDFDVGTIALAAPARIDGRVPTQPGIDALGTQIRALVRSTDGDLELRTPLASDGSFAFAALPAGTVSLRFEETGRAFTFFARSAKAVGRATWELAAGEEVVVPALHDPSGRRSVAGRVTDDEGVPVASARVALRRPGSTNEKEPREDATTNARGVFLADDLEDPAAAPPDATSQVREIRVTARNFAAQTFRIEGPADLTYSWCELRLSRAHPLRGSLVDAAGAPLVGWRVLFFDDPNGVLGAAERFPAVITDAVTDLRGEFDVFGIDCARLSVRASVPGACFDFVDVPRSDGRIELKAAKR